MLNFLKKNLNRNLITNLGCKFSNYFSIAYFYILFYFTKHASLVAGIDEEAGDVDSMYQLVLQRKGNLSAIEDEMDGK